MTDLQTAAQQALECLRGVARGKYDGNAAGVCATLEAALAQQAEPVEPVAMRYDFDGHGYQYIDNGSGSDWRERHKDAEPLYTALAQQAEPVQEPVACEWPSCGCRVDLGEDWKACCREASPPQQAEPVAGKVVAWGIFALTDGEWQLQHPVFVGNERGKENAECERASYSGPQPLEVRPLGVVTATAQQAEPVEPVDADAAYQRWLEDTHAPALRRMDSQGAFAAGWQAALAQQAEPPVDDPHRDHWVAIAEAAQKIAASTECGPAEAEALCAALDRLTAAALEQQAEPVEPVAWRFQSAVGGWAYGSQPPLGIKYPVHPLYTAPPQRPPLTEEEIDVVLKKAREDVETGWPYSPSYVLLAIRGVERAHGIGEQDAQV